MYGKVTVYFKDRGFGFIQGQDGHSYFIHVSKINGEYIERGYYVHFRTFQNERSDYNAKDVTVIETPENNGNCICGAKRSHRKKKVCNADRVAVDSKDFIRFTKKFLYEQRSLKREAINGSKGKQHEGTTESITASNHESDR